MVKDSPWCVFIPTHISAARGGAQSGWGAARGTLLRGRGTRSGGQEFFLF